MCGSLVRGHKASLGWHLFPAMSPSSHLPLSTWFHHLPCPEAPQTLSSLWPSLPFGAQETSQKSDLLGGGWWPCPSPVSPSPSSGSAAAPGLRQKVLVSSFYELLQPAGTGQGLPLGRQPGLGRDRKQPSDSDHGLGRPAVRWAQPGLSSPRSKGRNMSWKQEKARPQVK
jgi:hypothetical protein